jgi:UDP-N-acetyl-D-glucosamine dehydrogenase
MSVDVLPVRSLDERSLEIERAAYLQALEEEVGRGARVSEEAAVAHALVAVVGLGQTGLSSALALRRAGMRIVGVETSPGRLQEIRCRGAGLLDAHRRELRALREEEEFALTDSVEAVGAADLVLICVPSAIDRHRRPQPDALRRACAAVVRCARAGQTLVLSSTTYVGSTRELLVEPLAERGMSAGEDVFVAFAPQPRDASSAQESSARGPIVVGGVTETCFRRAAALLRHAGEELVRVSSPETAEMVKLYESTFSVVNAALAFELADACRARGLRPAEVANAAAAMSAAVTVGSISAAVPNQGVATDPHMLLHPLREQGCPATLAEEALRRVDARPRRLAMRAHELLARSGRPLRDARVLVVGACCEPAMADRHQTPAGEIIGRLRATGAQVDFHDPLVPVLLLDGEELYGVDPDPRRDASGFGPEDYDLAVLLCARDGYDYGWLRRCRQVLDCTYGEQTGRRYFLP